MAAASTELSEASIGVGGSTFLVGPRVPHGLAAAVEGLTREVLREKPEDIYVFAARHFEQLLKLRERYRLREIVQIDQQPGRQQRERRRPDSKSTYRRYPVDEARYSNARRTRKTGDTSDESGWSFNETAKVLQRYRNIFGEEGKRISTEDIRALANGKAIRVALDTKVSRSVLQNDEKLSRSSYRSSKRTSDSRKLHEEMKSELRRARHGENKRNQDSEDDQKRKEKERRIKRDRSRNKSTEKVLPRERRTVERNDKRDDLETDDTQSSKRMPRQRSSSRDQTIKSNESFPGQSSLDTENLFEYSLETKTPQMDRVREYVVRSFASPDSFDVLRSPRKYVQKVQDVIDSTAPIIQEKIEELKNATAPPIDSFAEKNSERKIDSKEEPKISEETEITKQLDEKDRISDDFVTKEVNKSLENSNADSLSEELINAESISDSREGNASNGKYRPSSGSKAPAVSLPAVRPRSSKNNNRSVSRNGLDNLVLPPISPEVPNVSKKKDELTLPLLSVVNGRNVTPDAKSEELIAAVLTTPDETVSLSESVPLNENVTQENRDAKLPDESEIKIEKREAVVSNSPAISTNENLENVSTSQDDNFDKVLPAENVPQDRDAIDAEEMFNDSLNVTPEIATPRRPDSSEQDDERIFKDSLNVTPDIIETLQDNVKDEENVSSGLTDKLLEIEMAERDLAKVLESRKAEESRNNETEEIDDVSNKEEVTPFTDSIKTKLIELKETGERIDMLLSADSSKRQAEEESQVLKDDETSIDDVDISDKLADKLDQAEPDIEPIKPPTDEKENQENKNKKIVEEIETQEAEPTQKNYDATKNVSENESITEISPSTNGKDSPTDGVSLTPTCSKDIPFSYVLTEGSPCKIPDSVTTVIIPERLCRSPVSDIVENEEQENNIEPGAQNLEEKEETQLKDPIDAFGEYIRPEIIESVSDDMDFIRKLKAGHDVTHMPHQNLDYIKEEEEEDASLKEDNKEDSQDTSSVIPGTLPLENISEEVDEKDSPPRSELISTAENLENEECPMENIDENEKPMENELASLQESTDGKMKETDKIETENLVENSFDAEEESTAERSTDSTNEVKETTVTDRSTESLTLDPSRPIVPELNLDSVKDLTISSFKTTDNEDRETTDDEKKNDIEGKTGGESVSSEIFEHLMDSESKTTMDLDGVDAPCEISTLVHAESPEEVLTLPEDGSIESSSGIQISHEESAPIEHLNDGTSVKPDAPLNVSPDETSDKDQIESESNEVNEKTVTETLRKKRSAESIEEEIAKELIEIARLETGHDLDTENGKSNGDLENEQIKSPDNSTDEIQQESSKKENEEHSVKNTHDGTDIEIIKENSTIERSQNYENGSENDNVLNDNEINSNEGKEDNKETADVAAVTTDKQSDNEHTANTNETNLEHETKESNAQKDDDNDDSKSGLIENDSIKQRTITDSFTIEDVEEKHMVDEKNEVQDDGIIIDDVVPEKESIIELSHEENDTSEIKKGDASMNTDKSVTEHLQEEEIKEKNVIESENLSEKIGEDTDRSISSSSSIFTAVTKIQAGIRGFLTRRNLQNARTRNSTLEDVPSIQDCTKSVDTLRKDVDLNTSSEETIEEMEKRKIENVNLQDSKARRFRREDAMRKTTLSIENAFASGRLQHTGEFHDCLPLPVPEYNKEDFSKKGVTSDEFQQKEEDNDPDKTGAESAEFTKEPQLQAINNNEVNKTISEVEDTCTNSINTSNESKSKDNQSIDKSGTDESESMDKSHTPLETDSQHDAVKNTTSAVSSETNAAAKDTDKNTENFQEKSTSDSTTSTSTSASTSTDTTENTTKDNEEEHEEEEHEEEENKNRTEIPKDENDAISIDGSKEMPRVSFPRPNFEPKEIVEMLLFPWRIAAKDETNLDNYLNFITSVEDVDSPPINFQLASDSRATTTDTTCKDSISSSGGSIREPLALPGTPKGVIIEEITSLEEPNLHGDQTSVETTDEIQSGSASVPEENHKDPSHQREQEDSTKENVESHEEDSEKCNGSSSDDKAKTTEATENNSGDDKPTEETNSDFKV